MNVGQEKRISAFCILCHDADAVLPFYQNILGFKLQRAEKSFYSFDSYGAEITLCLWEIGHIARHTTFSAHSEQVIPNKFILSLSLGTQDDVDNLYQELAKADVRCLSRLPDGERYGFYFEDSCGVIWEVGARENRDAAEGIFILKQITLLCQNLSASKSFYEDKIHFPPTPATAGRVTYPAVNGTALSLWDVESAATLLGIDTFAEQKAHWSAHTAMLAYPSDTFRELQGLYNRLKGDGIQFDHAPAYFAWEFNASYFRDPEENIWELFEYPSDLAERMLPTDE